MSTDHALYQLRQREMIPSTRARHFKQSRQFYNSVVVPNHTIYNVVAHGTTFRKFTPDGKVNRSFTKTYYKFLIAFAQQFRAVVLYKYLGPLPGNLPDDITPNDNILPAFLEMHYERILSPGNVVICKDFCLFTRNQDKVRCACFLISR